VWAECYGPSGCVQHATYVRGEVEWKAVVPTDGSSLVTDADPVAPPVVVEIDRVNVEFHPSGRPAVHAVKDATLTMHRGEILGIVGESGSGKSTLGRVLAGFLRPNSGEVRLARPDGVLERLDTRPNHGLRAIQMIFQESALALNPRMPVWRSVAEAVAGGGVGRRQLDERRSDAFDHLERVGINAAMARRRPSGLSGGEKQRVAIARAISARPVVLVCDEAVAALDVTVRAAILDLLKAVVAEEKVALFFIAHDLSVISTIADTTAVMFQGSIVEYGPTRRIIDDPQHAYTRRLIDAVPPLQRGLLPA
jgi:ABC-type glutathione transport system ATPase component